MGSLAERLFTPRKGEHGPLAEVIVERIADTGGGWYRPTFRTQNPATDPKEPYGGESSDRGYDHGWANCTMTAGAMVLDFDTLGATAVWGGDLRHHQSDQEGGTDLNDLKQAWSAYGQTLSIRSGNGWDDVEQDRRDGRAIVLQGEGGTPGAGTYTGGHAIAVLPETNSEGKWLIGNPECTGFEWVSPSALRDWAENWSSSIAWARSDPHLSGSGGDMKWITATGYDNTSGEELSIPGGTDWYYFDGTRGGSFSKDSKVRAFGLTNDSGNFVVQLSTGSPFSDGVVRPILAMVKIKPALVEVDVCPPSQADADIAEAIEARDQEWITHLTPD